MNEFENNSRSEEFENILINLSNYSLTILSFLIFLLRLFCLVIYIKCYNGTTLSICLLFESLNKLFVAFICVLISSKLLCLNCDKYYFSKIFYIFFVLFGLNFTSMTNIFLNILIALNRFSVIFKIETIFTKMPIKLNLLIVFIISMIINSPFLFFQTINNFPGTDRYALQNIEIADSFIGKITKTIIICTRYFVLAFILLILNLFLLKYAFKYANNKNRLLKMNRRIQLEAANITINTNNSLKKNRNPLVVLRFNDQNKTTYIKITNHEWNFSKMIFIINFFNIIDIMFKSIDYVLISLEDNYTENYNSLTFHLLTENLRQLGGIIEIICIYQFNRIFRTTFKDLYKNNICFIDLFRGCSKKPIPINV